MSATKDLARFISEVSYESLPGEVVDAAKTAILDGVANMLAGSTQELALTFGRYVEAMGGASRSTVVGWGFKTNPPYAAFANGVFGHCLDFEIQGFPPTHGTSSCLPTALALAEDRGASGKDIIMAYALGWEVQGRVRAASAGAANPAYHPPGLVGPLGGATAGAKVLGLGPEQTEMALGIAASRTGGLTANTGTMVKSTHPGNAARMGAEAALLAEAGFLSGEDILETANGYAEALFQGRMEWDVVTQGLGESYRLVDPGFDIKRFPAQIHMQNPIESVLNLREEFDLKPEMVESLVVSTQGRGHSGPVPRSGLDGKFSIEYCAAAALLDGHVSIDTFIDERRFAPDMEALLGKVSVEPGGQPRNGATATARLSDGRTVSAECAAFTGSAANPMGREQRRHKVWDCARVLLPEQDAERVIGMVEDLENLSDVSELMGLMGRRLSM